MRVLMSALLLTSVATPFALAQHLHLPAGSVWTLNTGKSDFGGGLSMRSDVFVMAIDTGKWGKFTDTTDYGDGKLVKMSWSGPEDGTPRSLVGMKGTFAANDTTMESLEGLTQTCKFSLSADRKVYTDHCTATEKDGKTMHQTIVYERTK